MYNISYALQKKICNAYEPLFLHGEDNKLIQSNWDHLHIAPVLPAHLKQRVGNLPERAVLHPFHQLGEDAPVPATALLAASTTACNAPNSAGSSASK